ncbi:hypothetical protein BU17DRAFT_36227 [Hysterangium stoloniferum]|nr:hypothetical protein BU17DRAFT_36227 [Hysterangium stoloniferum]
MFNPHVAERQNGTVTIVGLIQKLCCLFTHTPFLLQYLSPKFPTPPVPFELSGHIAADDWAIRVPALTRLASRYYKPIFERVWLVLSIGITLIPLLAYQPIFVAIYGNAPNENSKSMVARLIGLLMFFAALAICWAPIYIWKTIGNRRVRALLASYSAADAARSSLSSFVPKWSINTPGIFTTQTILTITTPPTAPITSFHPDAYLPAYIGKAEEAQGAYFYPYPVAAQGADVPRMSVVGGGGYSSINEKV